MSNSLRPHGLRHALLPCPSLTIGPYSNSCPSSPLLLPSSIFPSIRIFFNESSLHTRWPKYWNFNFNISPLNEYSGLISSGLTVWSSSCPRVSQESSWESQFKSIRSSAFSLLYGPTVTSIRGCWKNHGFECMDFYQQNDFSVICCLYLS